MKPWKVYMQTKVELDLEYRNSHQKSIQFGKIWQNYLKTWEITIHKSKNPSINPYNINYLKSWKINMTNMEITMNKKKYG